MMNKYLTILLLLVINTYANKNWIKFDEKSTKNNSQNSRELKMYNSKSTLKNINNINEQNNTQKNNSNPDKALIDTIREFTNIAEKVHSKIKK